MRHVRGLRCSVIRLITPPLPAASRPSKTTATRSFSSRTHCWSFTSSICRRSSSALKTFFGSFPFDATPSVFQAFGGSVLVETLGRPFARVLCVVCPVRLLLEVAFVEDGLVGLEGDQFGEERSPDGTRLPVHVRLQLVAESGDDAADHSLV